MHKALNISLLTLLCLNLCGLAAEIESSGWVAKTGSAAASTLTIKGLKAVRMPCNFAGTNIQRGCWDRTVKLDLTKCETIQFKLYCPDRTPISRFSFYMRSGSGWYISSFDIENTSEWSTVRIEKKATEWEDKPSGWLNIDTLRISAWRGSDTDTEFYIADMEYIESQAPIAIIRNESASAEAKSVVKFAQTIADQFDQLGIPYNILSDKDITTSRLNHRKLVILAYSPAVSDKVVSELSKYLTAGGKMLCFYLMPQKLESITGIKTSDHLKQQYSGHFSSIRPAAGNPLKIPPLAAQNSWNIHRAQPVSGKSTIAAEWYNSNGQSTGEPALIVSDNCIFMTHVFIDDDPVNKRDLLLAMTGRFCPELFRSAAEISIRNIGCFGPYTKTEDTARIFDAHAKKNPLTKKLFSEARSLQSSAMSLMQSGNYSEARSAAGRARNKMIETYCSIQSSAPKEFRAFWCHSATGVNGMTWDQAVKTLADNGFTAVIPNMLWGGTAFYNSSVLPAAPEVKTNGDQVALCSAACRKYGIECHIWKVCWNMGPYANSTFIEKIKKEGRSQVSKGGKTIDKWLCPSHPANQKLEIDSMLELVRKYDIAGIHFDYIRYQGNEYCFCKGCRTRFESVLGKKIQNWPADTESNTQVRLAWIKFRQDNITTVVRSVSEQARKIKPGIKISAAVFPNWTTDHITVAQDWKLWCAKGYLDFVCPMDYTASTAHFGQMVQQQVNWAGKVPCYPGIGLSTWSRAGDVCRLIDQVRVTREYKTGGFTVFEYGPSEARDVLPLCGIGLTAGQ